MATSERLIYRSKDNTADFLFEFVSAPSGERAYILAQPPYGGRASDAHSTHRYYDNNRGQHYICFDPEPRSRSEMQRVAGEWAENTLRYVRNGRPF